MMLERKYSFLTAKSKLEALCAYQERCTIELERKMIEWGLDLEDRDRLLAHLITNNFLNEERFAETYTSGKVNIKRWGKIKIRQQLKLKRISEYSINKALKQIDSNVYWSNLIHLTTQKWKQVHLEKDEYKRNVKIYRFLSAKGYEQDLIFEAVNSVIEEKLH